MANLHYDKHILICTNQKGECKKCCGEEHGKALVEAFKRSIRDKHIKDLRIRAQRAGCFDLCSFGPIVIVYPEGVYYGKVELSDVEEIVSEHIVNGRPVTRLLIENFSNA